MCHLDGRFCVVSFELIDWRVNGHMKLPTLVGGAFPLSTYGAIPHN